MDPYDKPIEVHASSVPAVTGTLIRTGLVSLGGYLAAKGLVTNEVWEGQVVPALLIIGPAAWGMYANWKKNRKAVAMARLLPDSLAKEK